MPFGAEVSESARDESVNAYHRQESYISVVSVSNFRPGTGQRPPNQS
jgi:hypothetical protein